MRRIIVCIISLLTLGLSLDASFAQDGAAFGDPPLVSRLNVSLPDEDGVVTITGGQGAVFPAAQVAVRNLYTEETVYVVAGIAGNFTAQIYGPGNTPFWISPTSELTNAQRGQPGSLPGGPGTIVYGVSEGSVDSRGVVTQLVIDGDVADWEAYLQATLQPTPVRTVYGLRNPESLYVAIEDPSQPPNYAALEITFRLNNLTYNLSLDPRTREPATIQQIAPVEGEPEPLAVASSQGETAVEVRIPLAPILPAVNSVDLQELRFVDAEQLDLFAYVVERPVPLVNEVDGIVRQNSRLSADLSRFTLSGPLAEGRAIWQADGRINGLNFNPGETLLMELDVVMDAADLPQTQVGPSMVGVIGLQPVVGADGRQIAAGLNSNNGWSSILTPSGLPIENMRTAIVVGEARTDAAEVLRLDDELRFRLDFELEVPRDLPPGIYTPTFTGYTENSAGVRQRWDESGVFGQGAGISEQPLTRLPLVLNIGGVSGARLVWTLFQDNPSGGSRGLISNEDSAYAALSGRVQFNSPTYIVPRLIPGTDEPAAYPLEPYIPNIMPNAYDTTTAPLVPFLFPGGSFSVQVTRPNGTVNELGNVSFAQNRLSTEEPDERNRFGVQTPLDMYRLTTLNPTFTSYTFEQYGTYQVEMRGSLEDIWGNRYEGGGTYTFLVADPLNITPGVLPGTPFEVGDTFFAGLQVTPGFPADVSVTVRVYPLDGGQPLEQVISGTADSRGYFRPAEAFTFEVPGEYTIDYEVRYDTPDGRLLAASQRAAGVVANEERTLILHGQRGVENYDPGYRPAWYSTENYAPEDADAFLNYPYQHGDVAWVADRGDTGINPVLSVQDVVGAYADWLIGVRRDAPLTDGRTATRLAAEDELPLALMDASGDPYRAALLPDEVVNEAYGYISAVRPDLTLRQMVVGGYDGGLSLGWTPQDLHNGQIGTGSAGERPGDYVFLFGGAVVRNPDAGVFDTAIYAALSVITGADDPLGSRVFPPYLGATGGPVGGPLFTIGGEPVEIFFRPASPRPGEVFNVGQSVDVVGQVGPPLASRVTTLLTSPSGVVTRTSRNASDVGYYFTPDEEVTLNEPGVWTVNIDVTHEGATSAGQVSPPLPAGGVPGEVDGSYPIFVIPENAEPLTWTQGSLVDVPPSLPFNFNLEVPETWTSTDVYYTVSTQSYILDVGRLDVPGRTFSYQYNPQTLTVLFPNFEAEGGNFGPTSSDVVTVTFFAVGEEAEGNVRYRTRTFNILHDEMYTNE